MAHSEFWAAILPRPSRYTRAMSVHPEGEDQSTEAVETVHCPHCNAKIVIPQIVPVDDFACPECGQPVPIKMLAR